jgi:hypothetical protein
VTGTFRPAALALGATALSAFVYVAQAWPGSRAIAVWIVLLAAVAFFELFSAAKVADEPDRSAAMQFEDALVTRQAHEQVERRPLQLDRVDRDVVLGAVAYVWARHGLLPRLQSVAAARLAARGGIDLARSPQAARDLLGEDAWDVVRPDRPEPADPYMEGVSLEQVEVVLVRLESL